MCATLEHTDCYATHTGLKKKLIGMVLESVWLTHIYTQNPCTHT